MKELKNTIVILFLLLLAVSCNKLDLNRNPVQPVSVPSSQRLPAIQANLAYSVYSQARFAAYHSYYLTSRSATIATTDTWNYNTITRMGAWRWHYFDVGTNIIGNDGMIVRATEEGSNNYIGVGKILLAYSYLSATDVFGDMPMKEAFAGLFNPVYDSQESILKDIEKLLDEGIAELHTINAVALSMNGASDLIYQGDIEAWKSFAGAVRARLKLRTANFQNGYEELLTIVNDILPTFQDAQFTYPKDATSGWKVNLWGNVAPPPASEAFQFADIRNALETTLPTDVLMKALTVDLASAKYDPRLFKLTTPGEENAYLGARMSEGTAGADYPSGVTSANMYKYYANLFNGYWTTSDSPYPFLLKEELYFIKAEVAYHMGNLSDAHEAYLAGTRLNMERLGVEPNEISAYMTSAKVVQDYLNLKLSDIMMQKYIALYLQPETWTDMRRYGYSTAAYPDLYYPKNALAEWNGRYIQRFPYDPQTEPVYNPKEIARLGAASRDWVFTPVWWAEKSTLKN